MPRSHLDTLHPARTASRLAILMAVVGTVTSGLSCAASDADSAPTITVKYAARDLATDEGVQTLYGRIRSAATAVCPQPDLRDLAAVASTAACRREAIARAVGKLQNSRLAAVAALHSPPG